MAVRKVIHDSIGNMELWCSVKVPDIGGFLARTEPLSPAFLPVFLLIVLIGAIILTFISKKKWGYTKRREQELERSSFHQRSQPGKEGKNEKSRFFNKWR